MGVRDHVPCHWCLGASRATMLDLPAIFRMLEVVTGVTEEIPESRI